MLHTKDVITKLLRALFYFTGFVETAALHRATRAQTTVFWVKQTTKSFQGLIWRSWMGCEATWATGRCPCSWQGMGFRVPPKPSHPDIQGFAPQQPLFWILQPVLAHHLPFKQQSFASLVFYFSWEQKLLKMVTERNLGGVTWSRRNETLSTHTGTVTLNRNHGLLRHSPEELAGAGSLQDTNAK